MRSYTKTDQLPSQSSRWKSNPLPKRLEPDLVPSINAALNAGDTDAAARERFAKVANTPDEVDRAMRIFALWQKIGGLR